MSDKFYQVWNITRNRWTDACVPKGICFTQNKINPPSLTLEQAQSLLTFIIQKCADTFEIRYLLPGGMFQLITVEG